VNETRLRRRERLAAVAALLTAEPAALHHLDSLAGALGAAKSSLSEDVSQLSEIFKALGLGRVETLPGPRGGVRFVPELSVQARRELLEGFARLVCDPARVLPGGFLYLTDLVCSPYWAERLGTVFAQAVRDAGPTHVLTVETKGIPLALMTARALGLPMLVARRDARVTEGPAVSITYVSGTTGRVQGMSLPRRALPAGGKVLIVDDFVRGGGTAKGLVELVHEFEAGVAGIAVAVATSRPSPKRIPSYLPLMVLNRVDEGSRWIDLEPNLELVPVSPV
jgi:purine operon repressor